MAGINNSWAAEDPAADSIFEGVRAIVRAVHAHKPHTRVVLQSILPTNDDAKNAAVVRPVNARLAEMARAPEFARYMAWLDLYAAFVDVSGHQIGTDFIKGLHPNAQGYRIWRDRLVPFLAADRQKRR